MTTIPYFPQEENIKLLGFSSVKTRPGNGTVPNLAWWVYLVCAVAIFGVCLAAHFIVKRINENRIETRLVRVYGKTSATTPVQQKFYRPENIFKNSHGISLIFSKEQNKRKTPLTDNWPTYETWKNNVIECKIIELNSSISLAKKPSNTIKVYVSDENMSNSASVTRLQDGSITRLGPFHNLYLDNAAETSGNKEDGHIKFLETDETKNGGISNIVTIQCVGKNKNTDIIQSSKKLLDNHYQNNSIEPDKAQVNINSDHDVYSNTPLINDSCENNIMFLKYQGKEKTPKILQLSALNESSKDHASNGNNTMKPIALLIEKNMNEKQLEIEKISDMNFKPPVTLLLPEKAQINETKSENISIKISVNAENNKQNNDEHDTSESKNLYDLSRSKESIKKSVSRVTFKHETMTPNVDDSRSEASRSRTEFLKNSATHSKESIMKSSVTHSKESIRKQPSRVTFVNGIKMPCSDSDSDIDAIIDSRFDITKITDSMTRLSEKTYSRESKLSDKISEESSLLHKKHSSKVNFSESVISGKAYSKRSIDIKSRASPAKFIKWEPENVDLSKSLLDQMVIYKSNIEQKMSDLMLQEASTSKQKSYEKFAEQATIEHNVVKELGVFDASETDTGCVSIETVCPNTSHDLLKITNSRDPVSVRFAQDNTESNQDSNINENKDEKTARNSPK